jgi:hypothetical protein
MLARRAAAGVAGLLVQLAAGAMELLRKASPAALRDAAEVADAQNDLPEGVGVDEGPRSGQMSLIPYKRGYQ